MDTSDAVSPGIGIAPLSEPLSVNAYHTICGNCGSVVDNRLMDKHKAMHKFFVDVVAALENHKKEIKKMKY